jgi:hypothetical protein
MAAFNTSHLSTNYIHIFIFILETTRIALISILDHFKESKCL